WRLTFGKVSWNGFDPDLTVNELMGAIENGPGGTWFRDLTVRTPKSAFLVTGAVERGEKPTVLDLRVHADRFAFQEWAGLIDGLNAEYMDYGADDVHAKGTITARDVLIASATARAYGANVTATAGSIGIDAPFPFHFQGTTAGLDLRRVPKTVPVPHVESVLT